MVDYEGSNHIRNPAMQRVLLTHEVICRYKMLKKPTGLSIMGAGVYSSDNYTLYPGGWLMQLRLVQFQFAIVTHFLSFSFQSLL